MSFRWTVILGAIVAGLVAFTLHDFKNAEKEDDQKEKDKSVITVPTAAITHIEILSAGQTDLVLDKKNGVWQMLKPVVDRADEDSMLSFMMSLANEKSQTTVVEGTDLNLSTYGLDRPVKEIKVVGDKGETSDVKFGAVKAYDGNLYALVDTNKVELVSSSWDAHLSKRSGDLRDKHLLRQDINFPDVKAIEIEAAGAPLVRASLDGKTWKLNKGALDYPVQPTAVEAYFTEVKNARIQEFSGPEHGDLSKMGLSKPALVVRIFKTDSKPAFTMAFAAPPEGKGKPGHPVVAPAISSDLPDLLAVQRPTINGLKKDANFFYDRKLAFAFVPAEAASITVETPELQNTFKKTGEVWTVEKSVAGKTVDSAKVTSSIDHLSHLEPVRILSPLTSALAKKDLAGPLSKVTLKKADGSTLFTFEWGAAVTEKENGLEARYLPARTNRIDFLMGVTENEVKAFAFGDWLKAPAPSPSASPPGTR